MVQNNLCVMEALSLYCKQADNNIYISAEMPLLLCFVGTSGAETATTEVDIGVQYKEVFSTKNCVPKKSILLLDARMNKKSPKKPL